MFSIFQGTLCSWFPNFPLVKKQKEKKQTYLSYSVELISFYIKHINLEAPCGSVNTVQL